MRTPTGKVKVIVAHVLSMRFAHSLGLLHGHLTGQNVIIDNDGFIQIYDCCLKSLSELGGNSKAMEDVGDFSGKRCRPDADVKPFAELLSRIVMVIRLKNH
jgi:hypothetical protein